MSFFLFELFYFTLRNIFSFYMQLRIWGHKGSSVCKWYTQIWILISLFCLPNNKKKVNEFSKPFFLLELLNYPCSQFPPCFVLVAICNKHYSKSNIHIVFHLGVIGAAIAHVISHKALFICWLNYTTYGDFLSIVLLFTFYFVDI